MLISTEVYHVSVSLSLGAVYVLSFFSLVFVLIFSNARKINGSKFVCILRQKAKQNAILDRIRHACAGFGLLG